MSNPIIKPKIDLSKVINPYLSKLVIKARKRTDFEAKDKEGKFVTYLVEDEPTAKVYTQSKLRLIISNLTPAANKLFTFILYELEYNNPTIWINHERYMNESDVSLNTYKKALIELKAVDIIDAIEYNKGWYWVNPQFFWSGDRIDSFKDNLDIR